MTQNTLFDLHLMTEVYAGSSSVILLSDQKLFDRTTHLSTKLHDVISLNTVIWITNTIRTSILTYDYTYLYFFINYVANFVFTYIYNSEMFSKMMILLLRLNSARLQACTIQHMH